MENAPNAPMVHFRRPEVDGKKNHKNAEENQDYSKKDHGNAPRPGKTFLIRRHPRYPSSHALPVSSAAQEGERLSNLVAFGFNQVEQFLGCSRVLVVLGVRVHCLEVEVLGLDLLACDGPAMFAVGPVGQEAKELLELVERQWCPLTDLDVGEIVKPNPFRGLPLGEEQQVRL